MHIYLGDIDMTLDDQSPGSNDLTVARPGQGILDSLYFGSMLTTIGRSHTFQLATLCGSHLETSWIFGVRRYGDGGAAVESCNGKPVTADSGDSAVRTSVFKNRLPSGATDGIEVDTAAQRGVQEQ